MLILLDEQLPRQLARRLVGHNVRTVQQQSWAGLKNGILLAKAEAAGFGVLVTGDQSIEYQQNPATRKLGIVVLVASSNALEDLLRSEELAQNGRATRGRCGRVSETFGAAIGGLCALVANTLTAIDRIQPGQLVRVTATL